MATAQNYMFILSRHTLAKGVKDGDTKSAIEYLKRRDKRYSDKVDNNMKVTLDEPNIASIMQAL